MVIPRAPYFIADTDGNIRFTNTGLKEFQTYFAKAGVNIQEIKTIDAYNQARLAASPGFDSRLKQRASSWPNSPQFTLLKTAVFGTPLELDVAIQRFDQLKKEK